MAKQTNDTGEVKKLLEGLYKIVQTTNAQSQEQVRINKELLNKLWRFGSPMIIVGLGGMINETMDRLMLN